MTIDDTDDFSEAARAAVRAGNGTAALDALGWWEMLDALDDPDARRATFALFRAEGRELSATPALGGLLAQPYLAGTDLPAREVAAVVTRRSPRRGDVALVVGDALPEHLLVDRPGHGASVVRLADVELVPVAVAGRLPLHELAVDVGASGVAITEDRARPARARSTFLGRVALASEILGASEGVLGLATHHSCDREQFGEPIGRFQAVRHLLAAALTDCAAVLEVTRRAVSLDLAAPPGYDRVVKALAGRNGLRVAERSLQVLGGVGFTEEHDHHHFHSRILALDALLGTSSELTVELGAAFRTAPPDTMLPHAVLFEGRA